MALQKDTSTERDTPYTFKITGDKYVGKTVYLNCTLAPEPNVNNVSTDVFLQEVVQPIYDAVVSAGFSGVQVRANWDSTADYESA